MHVGVLCEHHATPPSFFFLRVVCFGSGFGGDPHALPPLQQKVGGSCPPPHTLAPALALELALALTLALVNMGNAPST